MRHACAKITITLGCAGLGVAGAALGHALDRQAGLRALNTAYSQSEGDEGGFGGTSVDGEQCVDETNALRCVIARVEGNTDIDTGDSESDLQPIDFGIATFEPDGRITTRREPFSEPVDELGASVSARSRQRQTSTGNLLLNVKASVPTTVLLTTVVDVKQRGVSFIGGVSSTRTVQLPAGGPTAVSGRLTKSQKNRLKRELRRRSSVLAVFKVAVTGDVGPANALHFRTLPFRVARR